MTNDVEVRVPTAVAAHIRGIQPYLEQLLDDPRRFSVTLMSAGRRQPEIFQCTPESIIGAALVCAQLDLEPGPADHIYLIPRRNGKQRNALDLTTLLGYKGMKTLSERHPDIDYVETGVVHEGDQFEHQAQPADLAHTPAWGERGDPYLWYAIAHRADGRKHIAVLDRTEVERRRKFSASPNRGPWVDNFERMALKSAVRALWPELPSSLDLTRAAKVDDASAAVTSHDFVPELATERARTREQDRPALDRGERETVTVHGRMVDEETGEVMAEGDVPADEQPPAQEDTRADGPVTPADGAGETGDRGEGPDSPATDRQMLAIANLQGQRALDDHDLCQFVLDRFGIEADSVEAALTALNEDQAGEVIAELQGTDGDEPDDA